MGFVVLLGRELLAARLALDDALLYPLSSVPCMSTLPMPYLLLDPCRELGRNFYGFPTTFKLLLLREMISTIGLSCFFDTWLKGPCVVEEAVEQRLASRESEEGSTKRQEREDVRLQWGSATRERTAGSMELQWPAVGAGTMGGRSWARPRTVEGFLGEGDLRRMRVRSGTESCSTCKLETLQYTKTVKNG